MDFAPGCSATLIQSLYSAWLGDALRLSLGIPRMKSLTRELRSIRRVCHEDCPVCQVFLLGNAPQHRGADQVAGYIGRTAPQQTELRKLGSPCW